MFAALHMLLQLFFAGKPCWADLALQFSWILMDLDFMTPKSAHLSENFITYITPKDWYVIAMILNLVPSHVLWSSEDFVTIWALNFPLT